MTLAQGFEDVIISANNPNWIILNGVVDYVDVTYIVTGSISKMYSFRYTAINGVVEFNVEEVAKTVYDNTTNYTDNHDYSIASVSYATTDSYHLVTIDTHIVDSTAVVLDLPQVTVLNSALRITDNFTLSAYDGLLLTNQSEKMPLFVGYPKTTSTLINTGGVYTIQRDLSTISSVDNSEVFDECGVYIKWLNRFGGYSYWLFGNIYTEENRIKSIGQIINHWTNRLDAKSTEHSLGKISSKTMRISSAINKRYKHELNSLIESPEVYVLTTDKGVSPINFIKIDIKPSKLKIRSDRSTFDLSIDLMLPKQETVRVI